MPRLTYFNEAASTWDELHPPALQAHAIARGLDFVEPLAGKQVVDVGCGTGVLIPHLLKRIGETGHVTGIDFAPEMIARARARHQDPRVDFLEREVLDSGLATGSIDVVLCYRSFPHLGPPARMIAEWARWTRPGAAALIWHDHGRGNVAESLRGGGPIRGDVLPAAEELAVIFMSSGFRVRIAEEMTTAYVVLAERI